MTVGDRKVFGSGTRLYVSDGKDKSELNLVAYPPSDKQDDKRTMVCQASGILSPDLVQFFWKKKSSTGDWTDVPNEYIVEQTNRKPEMLVTSMVIVDKNTAKDNKYQCSYKHGDSNISPVDIVDKSEEKSSQESKDDNLNPKCPPSENSQKQKSGAVDETHSLNSFVYAYGLLLMKNGVYFCVVSIYLLKRKAGKRKMKTS